jgi:hypothetical protein
MKVIAHPHVNLSMDFISVVKCEHCGGQARMSQMLRGESPKTEAMIEIRLFECYVCQRHTVLELMGA